MLLIVGTIRLPVGRLEEARPVMERMNCLIRSWSSYRTPKTAPPVLVSFCGRPVRSPSVSEAQNP